MNVTLTKYLTSSLTLFDLQTKYLLPMYSSISGLIQVTVTLTEVQVQRPSAKAIQRKQYAFFFRKAHLFYPREHLSPLQTFRSTQKKKILLTSKCAHRVFSSERQMGHFETFVISIDILSL